MRKLWHVVSGVSMICFLLGIAAIGVAFFTGSSPSALQAHGHLAQYGERLALNWDILRNDLQVLWQSILSLLPSLNL